MIAGATYDNGIAISPDGAVYVNGIDSGGLVPAGTTQCKGSEILGGKSVDSDGRLNVRYV